MSSLTILLALHGWPPARMGGTGLYVEALGSALARAGHAVHLLAPAGGAAIAVEAAPDMASETQGWLLRAPPPTRWEETWRRPALDAVAAGLLARVRPDVVHVHHLSGLSWGLLRAARPARLALTLHDYAIPCARGQLVDRSGDVCEGPTPPRCAICLADQLRLDPLTAAAGRLLARIPRARAAVRDRVAAGPARPGDAHRTADRLAAAQAALLLPDALLSPSRDLADRMEGMGLRRPAPCALPLLRPMDPAPPPDPGPVRFLFASALIPTKGPADLLAAFSTLPHGAATLTLAGPSPDVDGSHNFAIDIVKAARGVPGVSTPGEVAPEGMAALLAAHDVLVLPSRWPENSPLIVREATAAGLRVVCSGVGGAAELAPRARLVRPGDRAALAHALVAEVALGRGRVTPVRWPDPDEHAAWLVERVYRGDGGAESG